MFDSVTELMICIACSPAATAAQRHVAYKHALNLGGPAAAMRILDLRLAA